MISISTALMSFDGVQAKRGRSKKVVFFLAALS
jgi:hypothetical protein